MITWLILGGPLLVSRKASLALAVCLALISAPAAGQAPLPPAPTPAPALAITGPATIPPYTLGQYTITGDSTAKVAWMVLPNTSQVVVGQVLVLTGQPGPYTVIAFAVVSGQPVILQQMVSIAGPTPTPTPTPNPTPTPTPTPAPVVTTGPYTVLYLWDTASASPVSAGQVALQTSSTIRSSLKALAFGNNWVAGDVATMPTLRDWASFARAAGTPCVAITVSDSAGATHRIETLTNATFPNFDESTVKMEVQRLAAGGAPK